RRAGAGPGPRLPAGRADRGRHDAGHGRLRPAAPAARRRHRRPRAVPDRPRRRAGQGRRPDAGRRRLHHQAVQPGGSGGPAAGGAAPGRARHPGPREFADHFRRHRARRRHPRGVEGGRAGRALAHRVHPAALFHGQRGHGAVQAAHPRPRVALRLRRRGRCGGDLRVLSAQEDRQRRASADPHPARGGLRDAGAEPVTTVRRAPAPPRRLRERAGDRLAAIPLRVTLVLALVLFAGLGLLISGAVVTSALEKSLLGRTDQQLRDVATPRPRPLVPPPAPDPRTPPSPFYIVVEAGADHGSFVLRPYDVDATPDLTELPAGTPVTVPSRGDADVRWRALKVITGDSATTVAVPLT